MSNFYPVNTAKVRVTFDCSAHGAGEDHSVTLQHVRGDAIPLGYGAFCWTCRTWRVVKRVERVADEKGELT